MKLKTRNWMTRDEEVVDLRDFVDEKLAENEGYSGALESAERYISKLQTAVAVLAEALARTGALNAEDINRLCDTYEEVTDVIIEPRE